MSPAGHDQRHTLQRHSRWSDCPRPHRVEGPRGGDGVRM